MTKPNPHCDLAIKYFQLIKEEPERYRMELRVRPESDWIKERMPAFTPRLDYRIIDTRGTLIMPEAEMPEPFYPEKGEIYWHITAGGGVVRKIFDPAEVYDEDRVYYGNCYRTDVDAWQARDAMYRRKRRGERVVMVSEGER